MLAPNPKPISKRHLLLAASCTIVAALISLGGIYVYYGYDGLPDSLLFRGTARHYCILCGSQALSHMTTLFDGFPLATTQPTVVQSPSIEGLDPARCEHKFFVIASSDRYVEFKTLRLKRWSFGKIESEPFWSQPTLVRAFANLSRSNFDNSGQLFSYLLALHSKGRVSTNLLNVVTGTNSHDVISVLSEVFTNKGNLLPSQKRNR